MTMRPSALSALVLVAVVGCGVPAPPTIAKLAPKTTPEHAKAPEPAKAPETPKTPDAKIVEEDPAKLGLKITDTKPGQGEPAMPGDTCYMLYTGRLKSNGTEFDSTTKSGGKPFSFRLGAGQVIKGWDLGVKGMKPGGSRTLEIPAALGYGSEDKGSIPPNSDLVFDIQLLNVLKEKDTDTVLREIVKPGAGPEIKAGDIVSIQYVGKLIDGKEFDSTAKSNGGKPIEFKAGSGALKVPGLDAAVVGLKKGEIVVATVPPSLGFGPMAQGSVPENSVLKFEITVVKVN